MVNDKPSDAASSQISIAPKRKRPVSYLDEEERRERKRAMDREAQRSLRKKTKTRIADLERTIEMLQEKDSKHATASLIAEIEALRAENERLQQIIDNVRSLVGGSMVSPDTVAAKGRGNEKDEDGSPAATNTASSSLPEPLTPFVNHVTKACTLTDANQPSSTEQVASAKQQACIGQPTSVGQPTSFDQLVPIKSIDLDGMNVLADTYMLGFQNANGATDSSPQLQLPTESVEEQEEEEPSVAIQRETTYMAMLQEMFGPDCRTPPPTILYVGNPTKVPQPTLGAPICPLWAQVSEVLGRIFSYRSQATTTATTIATRRPGSKSTEVGLLCLGIKNGWDAIPAFEWQHYPALKLVRQVDDLAFYHLPKAARLAIGYKCLKLLTYYLNATKQDLENVPIWLRPISYQTPPKHPIIIDFFAWPSLRCRFLSHYSLLSRSAALSFYYLSCLRFDWPFAFEDAFFHNKDTGSYLPSPLFETYSCNLKHWMMEETFYENFPEMRGDIEGDRVLYAHVDG